MDDEVYFTPFYGHLTADCLRQMLQQRFAQDYFQIAHALAPSESFMRHAALSSAIQVAAARERGK